MNTMDKTKTRVAGPILMALGLLVSLNSAGCMDCDSDSGSSYSPPVYEYEPYDPENPDDPDFDGIVDEDDNCPTRTNPDQADTDSDGLGNLCDNCLERANPDQADRDFDSIGDACDECPDDPLKSAEGVCGCGIADIDLDGDGEPDC